MRSLHSLRYTSGVALIAVIYLLTIVLGLFIFPVDEMPPKDMDNIPWFRFDSKGMIDDMIICK